jgi:hypothetical protein
MIGKFAVSGNTGDVLTIPAPTGPGCFIRIKALYLGVSAPSTVTLKSNSTEIGGAYMTVGGLLNASNPNEGILDCNPGEAFVIGNSAGTIKGFGVYQVVGG